MLSWCYIAVLWHTLKPSAAMHSAHGVMVVAAADALSVLMVGRLAVVVAGQGGCTAALRQIFEPSPAMHSAQAPRWCDLQMQHGALSCLPAI